MWFINIDIHSIALFSKIRVVVTGHNVKIVWYHNEGWSKFDKWVLREKGDRLNILTTCIQCILLTIYFSRRSFVEFHAKNTCSRKFQCWFFYRSMAFFLVFLCFFQVFSVLCLHCFWYAKIHFRQSLTIEHAKNRCFIV